MVLIQVPLLVWSIYFYFLKLDYNFTLSNLLFLQSYLFKLNKGPGRITYMQKSSSSPRQRRQRRPRPWEGKRVGCIQSKVQAPIGSICSGRPFRRLLKEYSFPFVNFANTMNYSCRALCPASLDSRMPMSKGSCRVPRFASPWSSKQGPLRRPYAFGMLQEAP